MVAIPVLKPLHDEAGLTRLVVSTYQAVSGGGVAAVRELAEQLAKTADNAAELTFDGTAVEYPPRSVYPVPIAHNVIPLQFNIVDDGSLETDEEQKYRNEAARSSASRTSPSPRPVCACRSSPGTPRPSSLSSSARSRLSAATEVLRTAPGVELAEIPTPLMAAGRDVSYVAGSGGLSTVPTHWPSSFLATTCARAPR